MPRALRVSATREQILPLTDHLATPTWYACFAATGLIDAAVAIWPP